MKEIRDKQNPNFHEVQQAFNRYWADKLPKGKGNLPKGQGYKPFKRWEWFWQDRVDKNGRFPRPSVVMEAWEEYLAAHPEARRLALSRTSPTIDGQSDQAVEAAALASPAASGGWVPLGPSSSFGGYSGVGRLNCIAFHPTDANTFWVGSAAGGLWRTTTGGNAWTPLTDNLPVLGISAIAVHPTNPNILYIATGDDISVNTYSVGVLKTTNGGVTWSATGLSYTVQQGLMIYDLIIHPTNPLILLAATSQGIYRTTNGGTSWTREATGVFREIRFKPRAPATVYATSASEDQVFRSTNTGDTWTRVSSFPGIGRITLAVTPANPSLVGVLCSNGSSFRGYYTSTNSGASFNLTYPAGGLNILGYDSRGVTPTGQAWHDLCLAISPTNASIVYSGGINVWKSTNGGTNWSIKSHWSGDEAPEVHADQQYMAYNPLSPGTLYVCNDGGLYKTSDGGITWTDLSKGLQITQFYRLGNSATNPDLTLGGSQDNGTKLRNKGTYTDLTGGDGMEAIIDYSNANIMYTSSQYGSLYRSTDGGRNFANITGNLPEGDWLMPYVIDPVNPQTLYAGTNMGIYKTTNRGSSWTLLHQPFDYLVSATALAVAPGNPQIIYAIDYPDLFRTTDGGKSWNGTRLPFYERASSLEVHSTNPQTIWITLSGYTPGEKVYRSDNGGASWTNISGTLPNLPVNTIERDKNTGILYAGTDVGVFVRAPGMSDWQLFDTGLPNVIVTELEIQYGAGRLRAATYGRGLWESNLYGKAPCAPVYSAGCTDGNYIHNFSFNTLTNNGSGCRSSHAPGYSILTPTGTFTTALERGKSYSLKVQSGPVAQGFGVWIDYNNDNDFDDAGEFAYASPSAATSSFSATVTIPATASPGQRQMRVRSRPNGTFTGTQSCAAFTYGEAEDYTITINPSTNSWNHRFGGTGGETLTSMIKTSDGGYLLGGHSASAASGDKTEAGRGGNDYWIVKINGTGTKLWDKRFGGPADDFLNAVVQTSDGGYLLGGTSLSGTGGDRTEAGRGLRDYWIVKVSSTGVKQWDKRFGGSGDDNLRALTRLSTGEFLLTGVSTSGAGGDKSEAGRGGQDYWIVKVSSTGAKLWDKRFGGSGDDFPEAALSTADGGYLLGGRSNSAVSGDVTQVGHGSRDYWAVKVSSTGVKQWDLRFGGYYDDDLNALTTTPDGGYLLVGTSASGYSNNKTEASRGGNDYWAVKVTNAGAKQWDRRFGGTLHDDLRSVAATPDGGYVLAGTSASATGGDKTEAGRGGTDYWMVKINGTGVRQWDRRYGGSASDELGKVLLTADGGYLLGGTSASGAGGDKTQPSQGLADYWLVKTGNMGAASTLVAADAARATVAGTDAEEPSRNEADVLRASPNPFTNRVTLQFTLTRPGPVSLKVYNEAGAEVASLHEGEAEAAKPYTFDWYPGPLRAGVYVVHLVAGENTIQRKIVRIQ
jgi:hypothetical protein